VTNRLANASSAYLRQHADNPVNWWTWDQEALDEAARLDPDDLLDARLERRREAVDHAREDLAVVEDRPHVAEARLVDRDPLA